MSLTHKNSENPDLNNQIEDYIGDNIEFLENRLEDMLMNH